MTFKNLFIDHERSSEEEQWVREELADQEQRFAKIDQQMHDLAPTRAKWYEEFFDRISVRGFNADGDQKVKIKRENLPAKPQDREDQVIWKYGVDSDDNG
ncbi:MAG: hypothetical protein OXF58_05840 [Gammaproteobacteria bacterium]|nr:hypothetical protein [Gammaproteobacteria bacterium]